MTDEDVARLLCMADNEWLAGADILWNNQSGVWRDGYLRMARAVRAHLAGEMDAALRERDALREVVKAARALPVDLNDERGLRLAYALSRLDGLPLAQAFANAFAAPSDAVGEEE